MKATNKVTLTVELTFSDELKYEGEIGEVAYKTLKALRQAVDSGNGLAPEDVAYTELISIKTESGLSVFCNFND